jgi:tRNA G18 (ribose-2'-O)-methylase SpoU
MRKLTHAEIGEKRIDLKDSPVLPRNPIYALADNIRSLYNVGSIFRSADGARISRLYLTGYTPAPPRKEIDKTALGATATVPWRYCKDPLDAIAELREQKVQICVLELTTGSTPYYDLTTDDLPLCLVVGNEITGVSKKIIDAADRAVEIPMYGHKQSLNVAVAFGVALYDLLRLLHRPMRG